MKKKLSTEEVIKKYQKMVYKIAHSLSRQHGEDFDELVSEGYFAIIKAYPQYNPKKAKLSTWLYTCIWNAMKTYCINPKVHRHVPVDFEDPESGFSELPCKESWLSRVFREIGEEARAMIEIALEAPEELADEIRTSAPVSSGKALRAYMIDVMDWTPKKVEKIWREIQTCLSELG